MVIRAVVRGLTTAGHSVVQVGLCTTWHLSAISSRQKLITTDWHQTSPLWLTLFLDYSTYILLPQLLGVGLGLSTCLKPTHFSHSKHGHYWSYKYSTCLLKNWEVIYIIIDVHMFNKQNKTQLSENWKSYRNAPSVIALDFALCYWSSGVHITKNPNFDPISTFSYFHYKS